MANKFDLNTFTTHVTAGASCTLDIGGAVAAGKTRFLTYLRVDRERTVSEGTGATGASVIIGSNAASGIEYDDVTSNLILPLKLYDMPSSGGAGKQEREMPDRVFANYTPDRPDIEHPICTVTGAAYMMLSKEAAGPAIRVFAQYYDE